jgi:hypothetical protein
MSQLARPLQGSLNFHTLLARGNAFGQPNVPALFGLVHSQHYATLAWRVLHRLIEEQKPRAQLGDWNRVTIQKKMDPNVGGMAYPAA